MEFKLSFVQCIISSKVHLLCYHSIVNIIPRASQPTYAVLRAGPTPPIQMPLPSPPIQTSSLFPISSDFLPTIHPQTIRFQHPTGPQKNRNCYLLPCLTLFFLHLTAAPGNNICSAGLNADSSTNMFSQPQSNERRRYL